ncbi:MAG: NAD/NADP octopine/nopaline dehydrogenase family protein [Anaerolineaceae bacterium]|nr:NAD/NADP octopine/nopaline dehydrogenase family protein [Anaerolineaceae bacterium]
MGAIERILVMGAGPGGMAAAAALSRRGYHVHLYNRSPERIAAIVEQGGVTIEGDLVGGDEAGELVPLALITTDIAAAMEHVQLVLIAVPAYGQRAMLEACLPHVRSGQIILLLTGSAGSLELAPLLRQAGHSLDEVLLGETVTLPQSARMVAPGRLRIRLPSNLRFSAFPGRNTGRLHERLGETLRLIPKPNVLDPGLNNPNFMIHPAPMLLNYAAVERQDGYLSIMNEGMTPGVLRLLDAVDEEKMALQRALGLDVVYIDDLYRETGSGPHVYRVQGEPFNLRDRIWDRYVTEDVPYGSVLYSALGQLLDVPTPVNDSINHIFCVTEEEDYWVTGRNADALGIAGMNRESLLHYLETGERL